MCEIFLDVEGYETLYEISNLGNVRNKTSGRLLKPKKSKTHKGYLSITLSKNGIHKGYLIHRLVAKAFIPNPNNLPQVNHKDCNRANNNVDNLEWCSVQYNNEYSLAKPVAQYTLDGKFIAKYKSLHEAERQTGIHQTSISSFLHGYKKYSHAGGFIWKYV